MSSKTNAKHINIRLKIWRQDSAKDKGGFQEYSLNDILTDMSFLEMLDTLNEKLLKDGKRPVEFESDCREGICGTCSLMVSVIASLASTHGAADWAVRVRVTVPAVISATEGVYSAFRMVASSKVPVPVEVQSKLVALVAVAAFKV